VPWNTQSSICSGGLPHEFLRSSLFQPFALALTFPTFTNLVLLLPGWLFARRRIITARIIAAGLQHERHPSAFHRIFAAGVWCRDQVGMGIFTLIRPLLRGTLLVALDDTLVRKRGLKIFGVSMHHDPLKSSRKKAITNWGHKGLRFGFAAVGSLSPNALSPHLIAVLLLKL
jgi:hypothetical protein